MEKKRENARKLVGVVRLERTTSWSQTMRANQLRYTPRLGERRPLLFYPHARRPSNARSDS